MGNMLKRSKGNNKLNQKGMVQQPMPIQYGLNMGQMPMRPPMMANQMSYGYPNAGGMMLGYPDQASMPSYNNDMILSNITGLSPTDIGNLRMEFYNYANPNGIIDRDGFRKLYIASLVNRTWDMLDREAEMAFRNFDVNRNGGLDFNEYMLACTRMLGGSF